MGLSRKGHDIRKCSAGDTTAAGMRELELFLL
jgi:hypothetical protein